MRNEPVVLISDVHSNYQALCAVDEDLSRRFKDHKPLVVNGGDILDYGADPELCIQLLKKYNIVASVIGNHDEALIGGTHDKRFDTPHGKISLEITRNSLNGDSLDWIRTISSDVSHYEDLVIFHGTLNDKWENLYESSPSVQSDYKIYHDHQIIVFGHSHLQFKFDTGDHLFINPGSVGQPRNGDHRAQYAILYPNNEVELIRLEYDIDFAAKRIIEKGLPAFLATRLFLGI